MAATVGALAEVAEALVPVTRTRDANEAISTVNEQTASPSTAHERRVTRDASIQSRRIGDEVGGQDVVHRQLIVRRPT